MEPLSPVILVLLAAMSQGVALQRIEFPACLAKSRGELGGKGHEATALALHRWAEFVAREKIRLEASRLASWEHDLLNGIKSKEPQKKYFSIRALLVLSQAGHAVQVPLGDLERLVTTGSPAIAEQALYVSVSMQPGTAKRGWAINKMLGRLEKRHGRASRVRSILQSGRISLMEKIARLSGKDRKRPSRPVGEIRANETAAIGALEKLSSAQAQVQAARYVDTNANGAGEYAFFQELAGIRFVRTRDPKLKAKLKLENPPPGNKVSPALVAPKFGRTDADGCVTFNGYYFRIFLPGPGGDLVHESGPETPLPTVHSASSEILWCAYAWPVERGVTGNRTFFVSHSGDIFAQADPVMGYSGKQRIPAPRAALDIRSKSANAALSMGSLRFLCFDACLWEPIQKDG